MQELNTVNTPSANAFESASLSMHMQVSFKQALEKVTSDDIQQYYALMLQELQQLDISINNVRQQLEQAAHPVNTSLFKKEMMNRLNGFGRLSK